MSFEDWLAEGIAKGYCSDQFCNTHDAPPMHESEELFWGFKWDLCCMCIRLGSVKDWAVATPDGVDDAG